MDNSNSVKSYAEMIHPLKSSKFNSVEVNFVGFKVWKWLSWWKLTQIENPEVVGIGLLTVRTSSWSLFGCKLLWRKTLRRGCFDPKNVNNWLK